MKGINKFLIDQIIGQIQSDPESYEQSVFGFLITPTGHLTECGTPCCIAGWAILLGMTAEERDDCWLDQHSLNPLAARLMGIENMVLADCLFSAYWGREWMGRYGTPTVSDAVRVLTRLRDGQLSIPTIIH